MALYIGIYDVHPGDRKHFERLLTRISDNRSNESDILYIESFGSVEALLKIAQKFDLFIIDAAQSPDEGQTNLDISKEIRSQGLNVPILCYLAEDEVVSTTALLLAKSIGNVYFANKSIKNDDLLSHIEIARQYKSEKTPKIELRAQTDTYFVLPDDIISIKEKDSYLYISMMGDKEIKIFGGLSMMYLNLQSYPQFLGLKKDTMINMNRIKQKKSLSFIMENNKEIHFSLFESKRINTIWEKYKKRG